MDFPKALFLVPAVTEEAVVKPVDKMRESKYCGSIIDFYLICGMFVDLIMKSKPQ